MPPRSKASKEDPLPSSRRSARLAPSEPVTKAETAGTNSKEKGGKKRSVEADESTTKTDTKKSKTTKSVEVELKSRTKAEPVKSVSKLTSKSESKPAPKAKAKGDNRLENDDEGKDKDSKGKILKKGDKLPLITLEDEEGESVDVGELAGGRGVVIFVYPKADTPGCTNQACGFRDHLSEIKGMGYEIYGLSKDKPAALKRWKDKKGLNYKLLSDPQSRLIKRLGAFIHPNNSCRSHFIFDPTGELVDIAIKVKPADDPKNCLEFIKVLNA